MIAKIVLVAILFAFYGVSIAIMVTVCREEIRRERRRQRRLR